MVGYMLLKLTRCLGILGIGDHVAVDSKFQGAFCRLQWVRPSTKIPLCNSGGIGYLVYEPGNIHAFSVAQVSGDLKVYICDSLLPSPIAAPASAVWTILNRATLFGYVVFEVSAAPLQESQPDSGDKDTGDVVLRSNAPYALLAIQGVWGRAGFHDEVRVSGPHIEIGSPPYSSLISWAPEERGSGMWPDGALVLGDWVLLHVRETVANGTLVVRNIEDISYPSQLKWRYRFSRYAYF